MRFHQTLLRSRRMSMAFAFSMAISVVAVSLNFADDPSPIDKPSPLGEAAQPGETPNEPPPGEVQERGVVPKLQPGLEFKQITPNVPSNPPAFGTLPGEFAIKSYLQNTPFTARDGGHHSIDAVITLPSVLGPNQRFRLASVQPDYTTIQTSGGYYMGLMPALVRRSPRIY